MPALGPRGTGVALDDAVRLVTGQPRRHQGEKDRLAEDEAEAAVGQVVECPIGMHHETGCEACGLAQDVAGQERRIGQRHPFHRAVRDVTFVPERDVLEAGAQIAPQQAGQTAEPLRQNRVALVRHGGASLLAGAEGLFGLTQLASGQMADLRAHQLDGGADRRAGPEILGVTVACDHLRRRHRLQAERGADMGFDGGIDVRVGTHGAGQLADGDRIACLAHTAPVAIGLERPQGELGPEGGRFRVHAVGATRDGHVA